MANMICKQRLYLTADKAKVVADGDPRAAFLYAVPGDEIPESAVKQFGLADGGLPEKKGGKGKKADDAAAKAAAEKAAAEAAAKEAAEKAATEAATKEAGAGETKPADAGETKDA